MRFPDRAPEHSMASEFLHQKSQQLLGVIEKNIKPPDKIFQLSAIELLLPFVENANLSRDAVNLMNAESIVGKHIRMGADRYAGYGGPLPLLVLAAKEMGLRVMERGVRRAERYLEKYSSFDGRDFLVARLGRFQGDLEIQKGNIDAGIRYFEESIHALSLLTKPEENQAGIELPSFLIESLILNGDVSKGIPLSYQAFDAYEGEAGQALFARDRYVWTVWRSGLVIKMVRAILNKGYDRQVGADDRARLMDMYSTSKQEIVNFMQLPQQKVYPVARADEFAILDNRLEAVGWLPSEE